MTTTTTENHNKLTFEQLQQAVLDNSIDTVIACQVDLYGRLMGKRFQADFFINHAYKETHSCNYLLATDLNMNTIDSIKATNWQSGYGDYIMKPDFSTLCRLPWLDGTALVLCDVIDHHSHAEVPHSPRAILKQQISRLNTIGLTPMMATELEFFLFNTSYEDANRSAYHHVELSSHYNQDYHILQTTKEEDIIRAIRNGLYGAGIPVECSKGEASAGQEEINILYAPALNTADYHSITKNACKEIAWAQGKSVSFMAKWHTDAAGSSSHIHQSLTDRQNNPAFFDPSQPYGMSTLMQHYLAGLLKYTAESTYFLAPTVNAYKRFKEATFAPTKIVWSMDNRTAGYRICGENTESIRIECRIGGADLNPYLALAAQIAAGLKGIESKLSLETEFKGDAYSNDQIPSIPKTLTEATALLDQSTMLREAFGDDVINHYVSMAQWEQKQFDESVTDWERQRYFERI